jgi:hypothetical protein
MNIEKVLIGSVKPNPQNPRVIKNNKFQQLVKSIKDFPEMLELRPIIVNDDMVVLGGNMRLRACKDAGLEEVYIIKASELSIEKQNEFVIKDNVNFGEWDVDVLANNFEREILLQYGLSDKEIGLEVDSYTKEFEDITDEQAELPIVPRFNESYNSITIFCSNDMDWNWLKNVLKIKKAKDYKTSRIMECHVIRVQDFQDIIKEIKNESNNSNSK